MLEPRIPIFSFKMKTLIVLLVVLASQLAHADDTSDFLSWKQEVAGLAMARGISERTITQAMEKIELLPRVNALDARQPEFTQTFLQYLAVRASDRKLEQGLRMYEEQRSLLDTVAQQYGVDAPVLLALWGLETGYGQHLGNLDLLSALATLAFQGRRTAFFTEQLLVLLSLIDSGRYATSNLQGSWAGAFGHMQFIPSTLRAYGVDANDDGVIDLRSSLADAMASAANYLSQAGWRTGEPIALEVRLPRDFDFADAQLNVHKPLEAWRELGVSPAAGDQFPQVSGETSIVLPQGHTGPAFMVFDNFDVIMDWNKSVHYALTVGQLSNRLQGLPALTIEETQEYPLSPAEITSLQEMLPAAGFDAGKPDGIAGAQTQQAIRQYQMKHGMIADGFPSQHVLDHVQAQTQQSDP